MFPVAVLVVAAAAVGTARGLIALCASLTVYPSLLYVCPFLYRKSCVLVDAIANQHIHFSVVGIITGGGILARLIELFYN